MKANGIVLFWLTALSSMTILPIIMWWKGLISIVAGFLVESRLESEIIEFTNNLLPNDQVFAFLVNTIILVLVVAGVWKFLNWAF